MDIKNKILYDKLNERQRQAVFCTEGPLLILAGAGSGKTNVLIHRIAYLIQEKNIEPYNIMAVTFTNKAADEMKERLKGLVGHEAQQIWAATFHSSCVRILRRYIDRLGFNTNFSIYDADDQKTLMKRIFKEMPANTADLKERNVLRAISAYKDELISPSDALKYACGFAEKNNALLYEKYQSELRKNNALDFDDLINKCVKLFEKNEDVLEFYQKRLKYIMVDEYQDTNTSQFRLIELLASSHKNLCVVGDDDQSIYRFRGANIENILSFEKIFKDTKVVRLEQNYRSTAAILDVANNVISNNVKRKEKKLWTDKKGGAKVKLKEFENGDQEASGILKEIASKAKKGSLNDFALLYRTNAQSRLFEEKCVNYGIPYRLVGGVNFYQRKEIKDMLAYLKVISNSKDDIAVLRVINTPKRGIGETSLGKISSFASEFNINFYEACLNSWQIPSIGKTAYKIKSFTDFIEKARKELAKIDISDISDNIVYKNGDMDNFYNEAYKDTDIPDLLQSGDDKRVSDIINYILDEGGYRDYLMLEGDTQAQSRLENIKELISKAQMYKASLLDIFLEETSLIADVDTTDKSAQMLTLMTLHGAKGLEFEYVYMCGMEEELLPCTMSIASGDEADIEEERRLCYVGMTRAKKQLVLSYAKKRLINGGFDYKEVSRFIREIPPQLLDTDIKNELLHQGINRKKSVYIAGYNTNPYKQFHTSLPFGKEFIVKKSEKPDYKAGDMVRHIKFGEGEVLSITEGKKDYEIEVNFKKSGIKKMMAGFAKLEKM